MQHETARRGPFKTFQFFWMLAVFIAAIAIGFVAERRWRSNGTPSVPLLEQGTLLSRKGVPFPAFTLVGEDGIQKTEAVFKGKWNLIFFGYRACPGVCPATLSFLRQVWSQFPLHTPWTFWFFSLTPEEDAPERLRTHLKQYNDQFRGLTGSKDTLKHLKQTLGIHAEKDPSTGVIDHTAALLVVDAEGRWRATLSPPFQTESFIRDLHRIEKFVR